MRTVGRGRVCAAQRSSMRREVRQRQAAACVRAVLRCAGVRVEPVRHGVAGAGPGAPRRRGGRAGGRRAGAGGAARPRQRAGLGARGAGLRQVRRFASPHRTAKVAQTCGPQGPQGCSRGAAGAQGRGVCRARVDGVALGPGGRRAAAAAGGARARSGRALGAAEGAAGQGAGKAGRRAASGAPPAPGRGEGPAGTCKQRALRRKGAHARCTLRPRMRSC